MAGRLAASSLAACVPAFAAGPPAAAAARTGGGDDVAGIECCIDLGRPGGAEAGIGRRTGSVARKIPPAADPASHAGAYQGADCGADEDQCRNSFYLAGPGAREIADTAFAQGHRRLSGGIPNGNTAAGGERSTADV